VRKRRSTTTRRSIIILAGILPVLLVALLKLASPPAMIEIGSLVFDGYQRLSPRPFKDAGVRVVDIDDESIRRLGQWPWSRSDMAGLAGTIANAGAAAISFDIVFSEPDRTSPSRIAAWAQTQGVNPQQVADLRNLPEPDAQFAAMLQQTPSVLGFFLTHAKSRGPIRPKAGFAIAGTDPGASITAYSGGIMPLSAFQAAAHGLGFVSMRPDADGIVRRAPLVARAEDALLPSLSAETLRVAQGAGGIIIRSSDASGEVNAGAPEMVGLKIGAAEVPVNERGELWLHYTGGAPERTVPAWKVRAGNLPQAELERLFSGRIVLIGTSAIGLTDLVATPVRERDAGVNVHAQAIEQMVLGDYLYRPDWVAGLEMAALLVAGLMLAFALPWLGAIRGGIMALALMTAVGGGSWYAFKAHNLLVDPTAPMLAVIASYIVVTLFTYLREERQRQYIHGAFDRYLAPELVRRITDDPGQLELGGEEREMSVLFCDIRGFSHVSEGLSPQQIIRFIIAFLTPMTDILLAHKATIDKYIGDAVLAFWNAPLDDPDQYRHAAKAALAMVARLGELNAEMAQQEKIPWPGEIAIGIGLNSGPCCVGNMGSEQRLSYSLIGDTVNLASRIEGLTKHYGVRIAIGSALAGRIPEFALIELDRVKVVGRDRPETIHALVGNEAMAASAEFIAFRRGHETMLADYRSRRWDEALNWLDGQADRAASYGLAKVYAEYRALAESYTTSPPPEDWDAVVTAKEK
jgi:adenylate cyclase